MRMLIRRNRVVQSCCCTVFLQSVSYTQQLYTTHVLYRFISFYCCGVGFKFLFPSKCTAATISYVNNKLCFYALTLQYICIVYKCKAH